MDEPKPKKISVDQVEVIDAQGHVIQESKDSEQQAHEYRNPFAKGQIKVFKGGPAMLLLLPVLIPLMLVGFILLLIFAIFFGRRAFKVVRFK